MLSGCTNYSATMPDITVFMNCDTRLAINLSAFNIGQNDEFIFVIKNYNYIDSSYVFLYRAAASEIDNNGEIMLRITPATSKLIKPGAFYNLAVMRNAFDHKAQTEYQKLTDNGNISLAYGAQDLLEFDLKADHGSEVISVRLEPIDESTDLDANKFMGEIVSIHLEPVEE